MCELIAARLADLESAEWDVLELLALGEPLELEVLAQISDLAAGRRGPGRSAPGSGRPWRPAWPLLSGLVADQHLAADPPGHAGA
ncbi:MAG TPA: hypothetical protein VFQ77_09645 [Pseudonocardiaceae bacterium]|nr:hypothetical protein [Pseudonocardiaceae bacterium]